MRSLLGRFHRPNARSQSQQLFMLNNLGDGSTLSMDFTTGVLDPRLTFTRSTTGTYINSSGYVTSAAINAPRFEYDPTALTPRGLLIEGSATNLALRSNDLNTTVVDGTQWAVSGYTRGDVSTTLPDGTTGNACRISGTGSSSFRSAAITVTASTVYTFSFWARNNGGSQARYRVWNVTAGSSIVDYTLSGSNYVSQIGGANNTSTIWVRVSVTFTTPVGCTSIYVYPTSSDSGTVDVLYWGAQVEAGSGASSYIPTGASTGSRAADFAVLSDLSAIGFNTAGGSMVMRGYQTKLSSGSFPALAAFLDSGDVDVFGIRNDVAGAVMFGRFAGTSTSAEATRTITNNAAYAFGMSADPTITTGAITVSMNGSSTTANKIGSATAITTPTKFAITRPGYGLYINCGTIRSIKYWPSIKTAAELNSLTT